jgi:GNAT superfamily N-acetyltransferase
MQRGQIVPLSNGVVAVSSLPQFRPARAEDLPAIVALLADDILGANREKPGLPLDPRYLDAFADLDRDPNQLLAVAEVEGEVVGTLQVSFLRGIGRLGASRAIIEAVRVASPHRSKGWGEAMIRWAIEQCRSRDCFVVQLTTDKVRVKAHRFYDRLGFQQSHLGYKMIL